MNRARTWLVAGTVFASSAVAAPLTNWSDIFRMADSNQSGSVTMTEVESFQATTDYPGFRPWMKDHFGALDKNGDGQVTMEEMHVSMEGMGMNDAALSQAFFENFGFMPPRR